MSDRIEIRKNTANTWMVSSIDVGGDVLFSMVVDSGEKVVELIRFAGSYHR